MSLQKVERSSASHPRQPLPFPVTHGYAAAAAAAAAAAGYEQILGLPFRLLSSSVTCGRLGAASSVALSRAHVLTCPSPEFRFLGPKFHLENSTLRHPNLMKISLKFEAK